MMVARLRAPLLAVLILAAFALAARAQPASRVYNTVHCQGEGPKVDGLLDDACWGLVEWSGDFVQYQPSEGDPPSQQTEFKVIYDDHALYFGIRAHDSHPEEIVNRLARRDWFPGDWVEINIDSYGDKRTAFSFTSSVSGTRGDEFISNDGDDWDGSWDPVWNLATNIDAEGWTAEIRIPLSQLRFNSAIEQSWGLQVQRRVFREEERSVWAPVVSDESGWVSRFGDLNGIKSISAGRRLELTPYGVASGTTYPEIAGDPFNDGQDGEFSLGLDGKFGVTNNLTLDFTFNPDFGQIEADPSEVNLSAFETFFPERRPFFIEGRNILEFQLSPAVTGGPFTSDRLFYSRRIGGQPHAQPHLVDGEYADLNEQSSIIAAAKLTGKTSKGLSIGLLQSLTAEEKVQVAGLTGDREEIVEPLTNYLVGRLQQDFNDGATHIGLIGTSVHRRLDGTGIDFLHQQAYAGGVDFHHSWSKRRWYVEGSSLVSLVKGSEEALARTQRSSSRYFQRPDNDSADFDPTRTSLSGSAHSLRLGLSRGEGLRFQTGITGRTPGFEINDAGYQRNADEINQFTWAGYNWSRPFLLFRQASLNANQWNDWDFSGAHLRAAYNSNFNLQWKNYWRMGSGITRAQESISNTALRGGPSAKLPGQTGVSVWIESDNRKSVTWDGGGYKEVYDDGAGSYSELWTGLAWRPTNALQVSCSPNWSMNSPDMQYVSTRDFNGDARYIFGSLEQETVSFTVRLDYTITPNLTLQYYGSPFLSSGQYDEFRRVTSPHADAYSDRFEIYADSDIRLDDGVYVVDEDGDAVDDYQFGQPDFDVRDFNSNLVLRWEYSPGSTLFLVWSQNRAGFDQRGRLEFQQDLGKLFEEEARNVFLVKFSKWFSI